MQCGWIDFPGDTYYQDLLRDGINSRCRDFVTWWGLPSRLEWALAPDRGALGYQTGPLAARMAFRRLRGPWVQELKSSSFLRAVPGWSAGLLRPAVEVLAVFLG